MICFHTASYREVSMYVVNVDESKVVEKEC